jgi:hypothetical protein
MPTVGEVVGGVSAAILVAVCLWFLRWASKSVPYPAARLFAKISFYFVVVMVGLMVLAIVVPLMLWFIFPEMRKP